MRGARKESREYGDMFLQLEEEVVFCGAEGGEAGCGHGAARCREEERVAGVAQKR